MFVGLQSHGVETNEQKRHSKLSLVESFLLLAGAQPPFLSLFLSYQLIKVILDNLGLRLKTGVYLVQWLCLGWVAHNPDRKRTEHGSSTLGQLTAYGSPYDSRLIPPPENVPEQNLDGKWVFAIRSRGALGLLPF